jgi:hypothetical protein
MEDMPVGGLAVEKENSTAIPPMVEMMVFSSAAK